MNKPQFFMLLVMLGQASVNGGFTEAGAWPTKFDLTAFLMTILTVVVI